MSKTPAARQDDWEKQYAPKVGRGRIMFVSILYLAWIAFLAVTSAQRWLGTLQ
jgi:hypothetical protein